MSHKDMVVFAWELRKVHPSLTGVDYSTEAYYFREKQWQQDVLAIAIALHAMSDRFQVGTFLRAAGAERRPDGSMYPMTNPDPQE